MGPVAVGQSTSGPVVDQPVASAARPAPRSLAEAGRRSSGERTRTPKSRTRTCCVANYTTLSRWRHGFESRWGCWRSPGRWHFSSRRCGEGGPVAHPLPIRLPLRATERSAACRGTSASEVPRPGRSVCTPVATRRPVGSDTSRAQHVQHLGAHVWGNKTKGGEHADTSRALADKARRLTALRRWRVRSSIIGTGVRTEIVDERTSASLRVRVALSPRQP